MPTFFQDAYDPLIDLGNLAHDHLNFYAIKPEMDLFFQAFPLRVDVTY
jgi:hypothetical protein